MFLGWRWRGWGWGGVLARRRVVELGRREGVGYEGERWVVGERSRDGERCYMTLVLCSEFGRLLQIR